ncbi:MULTISPECIES: DUF1015 family protein [Mumia]|uniref:DUF1015 family protein n=1 Tax=Mumia TaxID=1546255 RepID=UPI00141ECC11|nr:DUF1015 family protein [Mumia sp. ZJ1417]QMW68027.1 DUF1015 family protein [Mumia sp. ZJ1417]
MDNGVIRPFRAVGFRGGDEVVSSRTYVPGVSWSHLPAELPAHHVLRLLEPAFRDNDPQTAARTAEAWLADGVLGEDPEPAIYASRTVEDGREALGVMALVDLESGRLRPHEDVIAAYAIRQARLAEATRAQWEPITAYTTDAPVAPLLDTVVSRSADHTAHAPGRSDEVWAVSDPSITAALAARLAEQSLVIADGHHRYAAWRTSPERAGRFALTLVLDRPSVSVGPIHRVVSDMDLDEALKGLPLPVVELADADAAEGFVSVGESRCVLTDGRRFLGVDAYECAPRWVEDVFTPHHGLESDAVAYDPDLRGAARAAEEAGGVALLLATPTLATVTRAATSGRLLPHKSSWFRPKPRVGMVMRRWD